MERVRIIYCNHIYDYLITSNFDNEIINHWYSYLQQNASRSQTTVYNPTCIHYIALNFFRVIVSFMRVINDASFVHPKTINPRE